MGRPLRKFKKKNYLVIFSELPIAIKLEGGIKALMVLPLKKMGGVPPLPLIIFQQVPKGFPFLYIPKKNNN